jgi:hypothetical protein
MRTEESTKWLLASLRSQAVLILVLAPSAALGQAAGTVQVAANNPVTAAPKAGEQVSLSPDAMQARIEAQQQEINELKLLVKRLQIMVEPQASTQPVLATSAFSAASARDMALRRRLGSAIN